MRSMIIFPMFAFLLLITIQFILTEKSSPSHAAESNGVEIFKQSCIACHSTNGIAGGSHVLQVNKLHKDYLIKERLLIFIKKNMPKNERGSLSDEQYDALVDFLWESETRIEDLNK
jgi:mono/diheme cytochrome c family protein